MRQRIIFMLCTWCLVTAQLPVDVPPIKRQTQTDGHTFTRLSGAHGLIEVNSQYYIPCKNQVKLLTIIPGEDKKASTHNLQEVIRWPSTDSASKLCKQKTGFVEACNNYIRVFVPKDETNSEFVVCGTNSLQPSCRDYVKSNTTFKEKSEFSGISICPYDPRHTGTSIYTDGNIYSATVSDFHGRKPVMYRYSEENPSKNLQEKRDDTWLSAPSFVRLVDAGPKVYLFYTEVGTEDRSGLMYSRVAEVCKNDQGGNHILRKQFTTFQKLRLNCSFPGNPPFYFNEISAITKFVQLPGIPGRKVVFVTMNTPKNSIWGSAICAFLQRSIEEAFEEPFLEKQTGTDGFVYWSKKKAGRAVNDALNRCEYGASGGRSSGLSNEDLQFIRTHPLKSGSVPSWAGEERKSEPLFMKLNSHQFIIMKPHYHHGTEETLLTGTCPSYALRTNRLFNLGNGEKFQGNYELIGLCKEMCGTRPDPETQWYQFTAIAIDTNAGSAGLDTVLLIGTTDGRVLKVVPSLTTSSSKAYSDSVHFVEETLAYSEPECGAEAGESDRSVQNIKIDKSTGYILVSFSNCISSIPMCPIVSTCQRACISARDPYCAWDGSKCVTVVKPEGLEQDVLRGDVTGLPECPVLILTGGKNEESGNGSNDTSGAGVDTTIKSTPSVATRISKATPQPTNHTASPGVSMAGGMPTMLVGFAAGVGLMLLIFVIGCCCCKRYKSQHIEEKMFDKNKNSMDDRKGLPESPSVGHHPGTNQHHRKSRRSESSNDDASAPFLDGKDNADNRMSGGKVKSGRKDSNRKSNGSYHRQDSLEKNAHQTVIARQTSRESNPETPSAKENSIPVNQNATPSEQFGHPAGPAQQQDFHRTYSVGNSATTPHNHRALQRNLSLQIPPSNVTLPIRPQQQPQPQPYFHNATPFPYRGQNPLEIYNKAHGNRDVAPGAAPWHTAKALQDGRQYQTTSLDRKALKSRSFNQSQVEHPHVGPPRNFSDTLPSQPREDIQGPMRKRYQSESMGMGGRPPAIFYASRHPNYSSIEEENMQEPNLAMTEPNPPMNNMMRPSNLPLMKANDQRPMDPQNAFMVATTPISDRPPPFFAQSPGRGSGYTLPPHLHRQYSDMTPGKYGKQPAPMHLISPSRPMHNIVEDPFPYVVTQRSLNSEFANMPTKNDMQSKSNPATPEWDSDKGDMFPSSGVPPNERARNPSGKSQGTPSSPVKQFPGFGHPDVIPSKINNSRIAEEDKRHEKTSNMESKSRSNERINTTFETIM